MTTDTETRSRLCARFAHGDSPERGICDPINSRLAAFQSKAVHTHSVPYSYTLNTAGRSFTLSFHLNSSWFFPKSHPPHATCIKCTCKVPALKSCPGFEDGDKSRETKLLSSLPQERKEMGTLAKGCLALPDPTNLPNKHYASWKRCLQKNARENLGKIFAIWVIRRRWLNTSLSA